MLNESVEKVFAYIVENIFKRHIFAVYAGQVAILPPPKQPYYNVGNWDEKPSAHTSVQLSYELIVRQSWYGSVVPVRDVRWGDSASLKLPVAKPAAACCLTSAMAGCRDSKESRMDMCPYEHCLIISFPFTKMKSPSFSLVIVILSASSILLNSPSRFGFACSNLSKWGSIQ